MDSIFYFITFVIFILVVFVLAKKLIDKEAVKIELPFEAKKFFFTRSEQEFFRTLNEALDKQKFTVFTKVRLADFIEVKASKEDYQKWWNKIRSKHVDFLIWDIRDSKIALAIELDGKSHTSEKMIISDTFKDELYIKIMLPFNRIKVGSDFKIEVEKLVQTLTIV